MTIDEDSDHIRNRYAIEARLDAGDISGAVAYAETAFRMSHEMAMIYIAGFATGRACSIGRQADHWDAIAKQARGWQP